MPVAVCFLWQCVVLQSPCLLPCLNSEGTSPVHFIQNLPQEKERLDEESTAVWRVKSTLSNHPTPAFAIGLGLARGTETSSCCRPAPQWARKPGSCKAFSSGQMGELLSPGLALKLSHSRSHGWRSMYAWVAWLQRTLLCSVLGESIPTVECVKITVWIVHEKWLKTTKSFVRKMFLLFNGR